MYIHPQMPQLNPLHQSLRLLDLPPTYRHWKYQSLSHWQVQGPSHFTGPVQPIPPHCPQCVCWGPVALVVVVLVVVVVVFVVVGGGVVVVFVVDVVSVVAGPPVAFAASTDETDVQAGFLPRLLSYSSAAPAPGNESGTQLYLSDRPQTVIPTQPATSRHEPTTLAKSLPWAASWAAEAGTLECRMSSSV